MLKKHPKQVYVLSLKTTYVDTSVSYELPAGINYHQIIGTRIRDNIRIKPMDCGKFHVTHYKHVTKGCVSNDIAMN